MHQQFGRNSLTQYMKSVYMIVKFPELQCPECCHRITFSWKIHFHDTGNSGLMQFFNECFKLFLRIICCTVRSLGCKIIAIHISPEINTSLCMLLRYHFLRFRILTGTAFHKFICRHQFNCIDTKLFPVRDHFLQCLKSSLCTGYRPIRFCISAHMQFIKDHFVIWNSRIFIVLPVKSIFFKKSSPDFVRIRTHFCTKAFPSQNPVRTGISIHLSIYQKIVLVLFQIKIRNIHCIYISGSVFFCKRNLHIRFC